MISARNAICWAGPAQAKGSSEVGLSSSEWSSECGPQLSSVTSPGTLI